MKVRDPRLEYVYGEGRRLSFLVEDVKDAERVCDEMQGVLDLEVKKHREKRSLTANAYAWKLMGEIARVLLISKDEVYEIMLKRYAPYTIIQAIPGIDLTRYGLHAEMLSEGDMNDWFVYKGSSEYDSKEMSVFVEGIKSEATALGIEVLPQDELEALYAQIDKSMQHQSESQRARMGTR